VLKSLEDPANYLRALEIFSTECKGLLKYCEEIIDDEKVVHLVQTYIESIFDIYLDTYIYKELNYLGKIYEDSINNIVEQLKAIEALQ
jgi:hypothetical protein